MQITANPLPDELDRGYLGRVMRLNIVRAEREALAIMVRSFGLLHLPRHERSSLEPLSAIAELDVQTFVLNHSMIPYRRSITSHVPEIQHGSLTRRTLLYGGMVGAKEGAYFCSDCVARDLSKHGFSYWRRIHQLPGQLWCPNHLTPLNYVDDSDAFLRTPADHLSYAEMVPSELFAGAVESEHVKRFLVIASKLMKRKSPLDVKFVSWALRRRAEILGLQTNSSGRKKPLLSDAIGSAFPAKWLLTVLPSLVGKVEGKVLNQVDGVLFMRRSASSAASYILAAATMYDSAEHAMRDLVGASSSIVDVPSRTASVRLEIDDFALIDAYVVSEGRHQDVAKTLSTSLFQVSSLLNDLGLPNLNPGRGGAKNPLATAIAFYIQGLSSASSAAAGKLTMDDVDQIHRKAGPNLKSALLAMLSSNQKFKVTEKRVKALMPVEAKSGKLTYKDTMAQRWPQYA